MWIKFWMKKKLDDKWAYFFQFISYTDCVSIVNTVVVESWFQKATFHSYDARFHKRSCFFFYCTCAFPLFICDLIPTFLSALQDLGTIVEQLARFLGVSCDKAQLEGMLESCNQLIEQCSNSEALSICRGEWGSKLRNTQTKRLFSKVLHLQART